MEQSLICWDHFLGQYVEQFPGLWVPSRFAQRGDGHCVCHKTREGEAHLAKNGLWVTPLVTTGAWDVAEGGEENEEDAEGDEEGARDVVRKAAGSLAKARQCLKCAPSSA